MISIDRCKEILGDKITSSEAEQVREALYAMVESILDNYLEEFATIDICKKPSFIAEYHQLNKAQKGMVSIVRNIDVESMQNKEGMK